MHYYKRNLGDYAKKAGRLSMLQHGSYTLLIDACYDREQFPTLEEAIEWTWASTTEEVEAVTFVLRKFFTLENGVYVQKRIQEEIAEYHGKAETNKRIAIERETKRKENATKRAEENTKREQVVNEAPPNHKPLTNNHKPISNTSEAKASQEPLPIPDFVKTENWNDFIEMRKGLKAKNSIQAIKALITQLKKLVADGNDPDEVVLQSIRASWKDLYAIKKSFTAGNQREAGRQVAAASIFTPENTKHLQGAQLKTINEVQHDKPAIAA